MASFKVNEIVRFQITKNGQPRFCDRNRNNTPSNDVCDFVEGLIVKITTSQIHIKYASPLDCRLIWIWKLPLEFSNYIESTERFIVPYEYKKVSRTAT